MTRHVMLVLFLAALALLSAARGAAQSLLLVDAPLPETANATQPMDASGSLAVYPVAAPQPTEKPSRLNVLDWSMIGAATALRVLDYTSTEKAMEYPQYFHEDILPKALVKNKPGFAAFQAGTVVVDYGAYRFLVRHHLRSLAQISQYLYVGAMTFQVAHNYQTLGRAPAN